MEENTNSNIPNNYKPLSPWAYFGYNILFTLPIIGLICAIIFAFDSNNINRRNFARSYFCSLVLFAIIVGIFLLAGGSFLTLDSLMNM